MKMVLKSRKKIELEKIKNSIKEFEANKNKLARQRLIRVKQSTKEIKKTLYRGESFLSKSVCSKAPSLAKKKTIAGMRKQSTKRFASMIDTGSICTKSSRLTDSSFTSESSEDDNIQSECLEESIEKPADVEFNKLEWSEKLFLIKLRRERTRLKHIMKSSSGIAMTDQKAPLYRL